MSNYIIWWGLFVLVTTVGLFKLKNEMVSHSVIAHYFFIQELAGIVFVMRLTENILVLALAVKGGFAPFQY